MIHQPKIDPTPFTPEEIYLAIKLGDITGHNDWVVSRGYYNDEVNRFIRMCRIEPSGSYVVFERVDLAVFAKQGNTRPKWFCPEYYPRAMNLPSYF